MGVGGGLIATAVVVELICAFAAAVIASRKGNSYGGYFFIGLFLGPLGVLLAVASPRSVEAEAERQLAVEEAKAARRADGRESSAEHPVEHEP